MKAHAGPVASVGIDTPGPQTSLLHEPARYLWLPIHEAASGTAEPASGGTV